MKRSEILNWLKNSDPEQLNCLWRHADEIRRKHVGEEVHLRGLVEISNHCVRSCRYCGINSGNRKIQRYRLSIEEILHCARQAVTYGYGSMVVQSGEDYGLDKDWVAAVIRKIKTQTPLAITLSLGERSEAELAAWRSAGADRYLLRFETSDRDLYENIHPALPGKISDRLALLKTLKELGYETGSGVMIGIPGQTFDTLAHDIEMFAELELDMIGVGPYITHPDTPLGQQADFNPSIGEAQVPNTELMGYKTLALTRIMCPRTNIPGTTALATLNRGSGYRLGLQRGANVIMPNLTPGQYRMMYEIYPAKACIYEDSESNDKKIKEDIIMLGRKIAAGRGDSLSYTRKLTLLIN